MSDVSYRCVCGATLRYKQDLRRQAGGVYPTYTCRECGTQVPGRTAEQLWHQHPS